MRKYDIMFRASTNRYDIIAKDDTVDYWFVYAEGMEERVARAALAGFEAGA